MLHMWLNGWNNKPNQTKLTYLLPTSFVDIYSLACEIHHYCTSLYFITQYLRNLCNTTLHNHWWFGSCSLLMLLIVGWSSVVVVQIQWSDLLPSCAPCWAPLLYTITLCTFRFMWPCIINVGEERTNGWQQIKMFIHF